MGRKCLKKESIFKVVISGVIAICLIMWAFYLSMGSPLNPKSLRLPDIDSSIFIYFGYGLHNGKIPYVDMVDHKGPLLWTIQWIGLLLGDLKMEGIWLLEWIAMSVNMLCLYRCARLFQLEKIICAGAAVLASIPLIHLLQGGNFSEEWALPFILISVYIFLDYFLNEQLNWFRVIICGSCFGAVLLIRANEIGVWIGFIVVVLLRMIFRRQWEEIGKCILGFSVGVCIVFVPYLIYYGANDAIDEMWRWSFAENVQYVEKGGGIFSTHTIKYFFGLDKMLYMPMAIMIPLLLLKKRFDWIWGSVFTYICSLILCTMGGRTFPHYAIVMIPCLIIPISYILQEITFFVGKYQYIVFLALLMVLGKIELIDSIQDHNANIARNFTADENNDSVVQYILDNTKKTDPILVMSLNAYYYDATQRFANTPNFIQHFMYDDDYSLYNTVVKDIRKAPPKLVIMRKYNVDGEPWGEWMIKFYEEMNGMVEEGMYCFYETDFFVAFNRM